MSEKVTQQKRERELQPRRSLGQPPPKLLQCALPYWKPLQNLSSTSVPAREDTPWPSTGKMLGNLFKDRNWLLPKNYLVTENKKEDTNVASARPPLKEELKAEEQATSLKPEKCGWGLDCPFCKSQKKEEESKQQQKPSPNVPRPQAKRPDALSLNQTKQQWEAEMESLNSKYNLDSFSDSELDSESNEGEQYQYKHRYETLI